MLPVIILLIIVYLSYFLLIGSFISGLFRIRRSGTGSRLYSGKVSVLIPFRNEAANIGRLLGELAGQKECGKTFEVLLADDHSGDGSGETARDFCLNDERFRYFRLEGSENGKKAAIRHAVKKAEGEWIIQLDADVHIGPRFLKAHLLKRGERDYGLVSAPVKMAPVCGGLQYMEALEFMSLNASGAGSFGAGTPVMCNGANMAYSRKAWLEMDSEYEDEKSPSGDDMFFLHALKKRGALFSFLADPDAAASIQATNGLRAFIRQRNRWTSKSVYYRDTATIFTALSVYFTSFLFLAATVLMIAGLLSPWLLAALFVLKAGLDLGLLVVYGRMTEQLRLLRYFFPLALIHYFYIVFIPVLSLLRPVQWKERTYKR